MVVQHQVLGIFCQVALKFETVQIPCDPKMLVNPLQPERLAEFKLTSLEVEARHEMPVPLGLGIPISALDIQRYAVPDEPEPLDPADALLLEVRLFTILHPDACLRSSQSAWQHLWWRPANLAWSSCVCAA